MRCHCCADAASRAWPGGSRQSAAKPANSGRESVRQPVSGGTKERHRRTPQGLEPRPVRPVKSGMNRSRHSPMGLRWLGIRADCCGKTPKALGKTPGKWGKPRSIRTADNHKSHKTWAATRQAGSDKPCCFSNLVAWITSHSPGLSYRQANQLNSTGAGCAAQAGGPRGGRGDGDGRGDGRDRDRGHGYGRPPVGAPHRAGRRPCIRVRTGHSHR